MKFHFFHLMPYPDLPEDFREKHRSVWIDLPSSLFDPVKGHQVYNEYLDELEYADQVGFDGICINEHHQNAYGLMPSPNLMAATLARRTSRAKIVLMGNSVALYNPPIRVAEEIAMLDVLSGGRIVAGFPVGTPMDTAFAYGENPVTLREKYREGVDLILRAWRERDVFSFNGKYTQLRYVNVWPRPIQSPRPPVWVPGGASVETWDFCIERDFLYANLSYFGYQEGQKVMDGFWNRIDQLGAERNPYRAGFLQFVAIADSDAQAQELYEKHARYFWQRCLHVYPGFVNPPGYTSLETIRAGIQGQVARIVRRAGSRAELAQLGWKDFVERGYLVAGSPSTVADRLGEAIEKLNIGHLMVLCQFGDMPKEKALENTRRFAQEVAPRLRHRFSEWEDKWWPKESPVPADARKEAADARR
ncbi:MAG TPA: LLM class flavin-dependent oxidoreductase [Beijerinckiaceae bacterium]|nr:LLM class flavin-dependent oxidoreductase [Beijerinckiaceae bacterium]